MRIFGIGKKVVKLTEVFSRTVNKKTGTVVEKALNNANNRLTAFWGGMTDESAGVTRLITYGKKTPLYKAGIHQAQITTLNNGSRDFKYFRDGKELYNAHWGKGFAGETSLLLPEGRFGHFNLNRETGFFEPVDHLLRDSFVALKNVISKV